MMIPCSNKFCEPTVCNIAGNKRNTKLCDWVSHDYISIILHSDEFAFDGVVNSWVHLDPNPLCNKILVEKLSTKGYMHDGDKRFRKCCDTPFDIRMDARRAAGLP